jgi:hypothetical protein
MYPMSRLKGRGQGMFVNLADRRAAASPNRQLDLLNDIGPGGIVREITRIRGGWRASPKRIPTLSCHTWFCLSITSGRTRASVRGVGPSRRRALHLERSLFDTRRHHAD